MVGLVQLPPAVQPELALAIEEALVARVWLAASVKVVEVTVRFQPAPPPRMSAFNRGRL